jgi:hypothetical protein
MTMNAYAKYRGVSHTAVSKAARTGRITLVNGRVDPVTADRDWKRNSEPVPHGGQIVGEDTPAPGREVPGKGAQPGPRDPETATFARSRALRETVKARLANLEYDQKRGKLVDAEEVRSHFYKLARAARDMLHSIPDRLAPRLVGETDSHKIHTMITEEIDRVSAAIADAAV